jgi:hypothetical protein
VAGRRLVPPRSRGAGAPRHPLNRAFVTPAAYHQQASHIPTILAAQCVLKQAAARPWARSVITSAQRGTRVAYGEAAIISAVHCERRWRGTAQYTGTEHKHYGAERGSGD